MKKQKKIVSVSKMRPVLLLIAITLSPCLALPSKYSNLKIYGGKTAEPGQFPFVVAINVTTLGLRYCTGSIIHENWVLTTATCSQNFNFKAGDLVVISGTNQLDTDTGIVYNVSQIVVNPNYSKEINPIELAKGNIALFKIDGSFNFSDLIQPIELGEVSVDDLVVVAGFGETRYDVNPPLQYADHLIVQSNEDCKTETEFSNIGSEEVCARGGKEFGICEGAGDKGAPLVLDGTLVGLGARSVWECGFGYPDIYTRVSYYKDWINDVIKS